jgi:hypothetical protein
MDCVATIASSGLDVFAHNVETVERLQGVVRDRRAGWAQSLAVLRGAKERGVRLTKTSLMLGCGEEKEEVGGEGRGREGVAEGVCVGVGAGEVMGGGQEGREGCIH